MEVNAYQDKTKTDKTCKRGTNQKRSQKATGDFGGAAKINSTDE